MNKIILVISIPLFLVACGGGGGSSSKPSNTAGALPSQVYVQRSIAPGAACPAGGVEIDSGIDDNKNGVLDGTEVDDTETICHGESGQIALVTSESVTAGANCSLGGVLFKSGLDNNNNKILDAAEVTSSTYICNHNDGALDGYSSLVNLVAEAAGANCANGGQKITTGLDTDRDAILDSSEVLKSKYICNGANGTNGTAINALVSVSAEPTGANCANGGQKFSSGLDDNGNNILDVSEVDQAAYICNGASGGGADVTTPVLVMLEPIRELTSNPSPEFTFHSSEAGTILYDGDCTGLDTSASLGENTISFNKLATGLYTNCAVQVRDLAGNTSAPLLLSGFIVGYGAITDFYSSIYPGFPRSNIYSRDKAEGMALQADGKVVVVGGQSEYNNYGLGTDAMYSVVARYRTDGSLDASFDGDGKVVIEMDLVDQAYAVAIQPDGKIVVAGVANSGNGDFALVRYNANGSLDVSFSGDGVVVTDMGLSTYDYLTDVVLQSDGKIVVAGYSNGIAVVARYLANGSLDTSFSGDGKVSTEIGSGSSWSSPSLFSHIAVELQGDGKIVIGVSLNSAAQDFILTRYLADGTLDSTFGSAGQVVTDIGEMDYLSDIAIQNDGKIIAVGSVLTSGLGWNFGLVRYLTNGSLDSTFGSNGVVTADIDGSSTLSNFATGVTVQSDGKILVGGFTQESNNKSWFSVRRFLANGSLDAGFISEEESIPLCGVTPAMGMARNTADETFYLAGTIDCDVESEPEDFVLVRYSSDGSIDRAFH